MTSEFCPRCGHARTGSFRFCRSCQFDFDASAAEVPPAWAAPAAAAPIAAPVVTPALGVTPAPEAAAGRRPVKILAGAAILVLVGLFVVGWLGSQSAKVDDIVATATGWTLARAQSFAATEGFAGRDSPLADGTPRWLASRASDQAGFEAVGDPAGIDHVSLVLPVTADNAEPMGALLGRALDVWLLEATDWLGEEIVDVIDQGGDVSRTFPHGTIRVQSLTMSDGSMVTVTITRAP